MFKRKKKKTGIQTPELRKYTPPPMPPIKPPKPPTSGSNVHKPNPNYVPPASVKPKEIELCIYSTPCGWCTKWDKKCDCKVGCNNTEPRKKKDLALEWIKSGKGLPPLGL